LNFKYCILSKIMGIIISACRVIKSIFWIYFRKCNCRISKLYKSIFI